MYLIPEPQFWNQKEGQYTLSYDKRIVLDVTCPAEAYEDARFLQEEMQKTLGYNLAVTRGNSANAGIVLSVGCVPGMESEEAYALSVTENGIWIIGQGSAGLLYGVQTLRQLLRQAGAVIPCMEIVDYPSVPVRGYYYDATRCRIPTLEYLKHMADRAAFYKLNQLQLYVEHTYLFEGLSELWRDDTPLTAEDILELDAYCRKLHIDLVPSLSSFGHLYKLLRTKAYRDLCEMEDIANEPFSFIDRMLHHTVDVSNSESLKLVKRLIDEYMPLFTSKYYNICADETFDLGKGRNAELAKELGTERIYINFVKELCEYVAIKGKIPMFWGDIISSCPEYAKELPPETICLNWGYSPEEKEDAARGYAQAGVTQYMCPGVQGWNQLVNEIRNSYENITRMCTYARKYGAVGVLNTDWGDYGHINHPEMSATGMIYGAAFSWNARILEFEEMNRRISRVEFLDRTEQFVKVIAEISDEWVVKWHDVIYYKEKQEWKVSMDQLVQVPEMLKLLEASRGRLYALIPELAESARTQVKPYLVAICGMELLQKLGIVLESKESDQELLLPVDAWELASELETWFQDYKTIWRSVGREAELYRIQDVINWYADLLRTL